MTIVNLDETHISAHMRNLLLTNFTPEQLRAMASRLEDQTPDRRRRRRWRQMLEDADFEELADMLVSGRTPTIGWWRRHIRRVSDDA